MTMGKNMDRRFKPKIRLKLIASLLSVVIIAGIGSVVISLKIVNDNILGQAYDDVETQLNTAQHIYNEKINVIRLFIEHIASLSYFKAAIIAGNRKFIMNKLIEVKDELSLDVLNITDEKGIILVRSRNFALFGDDVSGSTFIQYVLRHRSSCFGTDIIEREYLLREGRDISERAYIRVIPTQMARKRVKSFEDSGMILMAASPIFYRGRLIGIVYGAKLLNNNFDFVDRIKNLVFKDEKLNGLDVGSATIFMDDLRISTNVKKEDGTRAIGTLVSEEVYRKVFEHEKVWLDKAFVVNNWYISGYTPIYNINNRVIGILYVGILEEKYNVIKRETMIYYLLMTAIVAIIAVVISIYLIQNIINPIKSLLDASGEIAMGNYNKKIEIRSDDEIGYLCSAYNKMVDAIVERDEKLKEQTERKIVQSEKLASLGRLASGIAHEINNPLTGVLGYSTVLLEDLEGSEYQEDLQIIVDETKRCRDIVGEILNFARETKIEEESANINTIISDALSILLKHISFQNIRIVKRLSEDIPDMNLDINQMKSVINNLAVNAADAMPDGGLLTVSTYVSRDDEVVIEVSDTGTGISEENLSKIFDPFFSTKEVGQGTGLGLAVTYGIIKRHNGSIEVKSKLGEGTTFIIHLPMR
jgi:two-component system NtrC family sensor kinase